MYAVGKAQGDTASGSWEPRDAEAEQRPLGVGGGGVGVRVGKGPGMGAAGCYHPLITCKVLQVRHECWAVTLGDKGALCGSVSEANTVPNSLASPSNKNKRGMLLFALLKYI